MSVRNLSPYEALGNAVVLQAVKDYRDAVQKLSRGKKNTIAESMKQECERFFQSPYFNVFTQLDGKALLSQLEKEVSA
ncbi:hypothetical protein DXB77_11665 [Clostridium sp. OM05-9]|uniref:hypothetical protein n=1 Tax=Clostridium sp. OM05-9 TaxID=2293045 RepID=UPI000E485CD0|nr:hypothetical protein [Clostridium sp. OM05-9]RHV09833.1 hypothetical protein DXB77_11665 [Clostridium sp. OM05-9]